MENKHHKYLYPDGNQMSFHKIQHAFLSKKCKKILFYSLFIL